MTVTLKRQLNDDEKSRVLAIHGRNCFATGHAIPDGETLHFDHIRAYSLDGVSELDNIAPMCQDHNLQKGTLSLEDFRVKLRVDEFFAGGDRLTVGARRDLIAAATCQANQPIYRRMVDLELKSTFSFQQKWLADVAPHLLTEAQRAQVEVSKRNAAIREASEKRIPKHLLYAKGWPTCLPTEAEATLLSEIRQEVAGAVGLSVDFTDPRSIIGRFEQLMEEKNAKATAA